MDTKSRSAGPGMQTPNLVVALGFAGLLTCTGSQMVPTTDASWGVYDYPNWSSARGSFPSYLGHSSKQLEPGLNTATPQPYKWVAEGLNKDFWDCSIPNFRGARWRCKVFLLLRGMSMKQLCFHDVILIFAVQLYVYSCSTC